MNDSEQKIEKLKEHFTETSEPSTRQFVDAAKVFLIAEPEIFTNNHAS